MCTLVGCRNKLFCVDIPRTYTGFLFSDLCLFLWSELSVIVVALLRVRPRHLDMHLHHLPRDNRSIRQSSDSNMISTSILSVSRSQSIDIHIDATQDHRSYSARPHHTLSCSSSSSCIFILSYIRMHPRTFSCSSTL
jgi:hypothetical protein